jgi:hypothetical protein
MRSAEGRADASCVCLELHRLAGRHVRRVHAHAAPVMRPQRTGMTQPRDARFAAAHAIQPQSRRALSALSALSALHVDGTGPLKDDVIAKT